MPTKARGRWGTLTEGFKMQEKFSNPLGISGLTLGETISPIAKVDHQQTPIRESDRRRRRREFEKALACNDIKTLERISKADSLYCKCEGCGKYFIRQSYTADPHICFSCRIASTLEMPQMSRKSTRCNCRWCGKRYSPTFHWPSRVYCSNECREKQLCSELRREGVARRREELAGKAKVGI